MPGTIATMIVGFDHESARKLEKLIRPDSDLAVVSTVTEYAHVLGSAEECTPDLMLIELKAQDGLLALDVVSKARQEHPELAVIVASSVLETKLTMKALAAGALEYVATDGDRLKGTTPEDQIASALRSAKAVIAQKRGQKSKQTSGRGLSAAASERTSAIPAILREEVDLILIGISTGGPAALDKVLSRIGTRDLPPILIVQHMGRLFTTQLAASLKKTSGRDVSEAWRGCRLDPNKIFVAPGGFQTEIQAKAPHEDVYRLRIHEAPPVNGFCPAVDVTWKSVVKNFDGRIAAFLMTGMGEDGAAGLRLLKDAGAACVAQDEASSVVWGMPGAAVRDGTSDVVLSLDEIADTLRDGFTSGDRS